MTKEFIDAFLEPVEQEKVRQFVEDDTMREAVRKIILSGLCQQGVMKPGKKFNPLINGALSFVASARGAKVTNEQIGADLNAYWQGMNALESAFTDMEKYRTVLPNRSEGNPAR